MHRRDDELEGGARDALLRVPERRGVGVRVERRQVPKGDAADDEGDEEEGAGEVQEGARPVDQ